jgi:hypothetical protein
LASILSNEAVITRPAGATLPEQGGEQAIPAIRRLERQLRSLMML